MMDNAFEKADEDGEEKPTTLPMLSNSGEMTMLEDDGVMKFRAGLVKRYHQGAVSLLERMEKNGCNSTEQLVMEMVREVILETDHLLGNELVATQNGNLRDASVISGKRAEVLQSAIKAMQTKQAMEKEGGLGVDVDSPSMSVVFRFFMEKVRTIFQGMKLDSEMSDTFFRMFKESMKEWRRELRAEVAANSGGVNQVGVE